MCLCPDVYIDHFPTLGHWNADCPDHGIDSAWYNAPEQTDFRYDHHKD